MKSHANDANKYEQEQHVVRCKVVEVSSEKFQIKTFEIKNTNNEEIEMQQLHTRQTAIEEASTLLSSSSIEELGDQIIDVNNFLSIRWFLSLTSLIDYS